MGQSGTVGSVSDSTPADAQSPSSINDVDQAVDGHGDEVHVDEIGATTPEDAASTRSPVVEVLPPEGQSFDQDQYADMLVERTQISVGLTGLSLKRTRMSGGSGQTQGGPTPSGAAVSTPIVDRQPSPSQSAEDRPAAAGPDAPRQTQPAEEPAASDDAQSDSSPEQADSDIPDFENAQLFSQFLVGLLSYGVAEVMERIHYYDDEIDRNPQAYDLDEQIDQAEESIETIFRYWLIGIMMWSERKALTLSYRTFQKSLSIGSFALRTADRTTDNFLFRPLRRPFERLLPSLHQDSQDRIDEGRSVERRGYVLAEETLDDIVGDFIDYLAENPQLVELISTSSIGLAGTVMDNGRQVSAVTDTVLENLVHRIFRRPKREELPPSPYEGKPQTMYDPTTQHYAQPGSAKD